MTDVQHEKFARLMREVEELEEQVMKLEAAGADLAKLKLVMEELAEARRKLTRLSDGCGPGRSN
jgi:hypothetical protein